MEKDFWFAFGSGAPAAYGGLTPTFTHWFSPLGATYAPPAITEPIAGSGVYHFKTTPTLALAFIIDGSASITQSSDRYLKGAVSPFFNVDTAVDTLQTELNLFRNSADNKMNLATAQGATLIVKADLALAGIANVDADLGFAQVDIDLLQADTAALIARGVSLTAQSDILTAQGVTILASTASLTVSVGTLTVSVAGLGDPSSSFGDNVTAPDTLFGSMRRLMEFWEGDTTFNKGTGSWQVFDRSGLVLLADKTISDSATMTIKT